MMQRHLLAALPPLGAARMQSDPVAYVRLYVPGTGWMYLLEFDGSDRVLTWQPERESELEERSLAGLAAIRGPRGVSAEIDEHFVPAPVSQLRERALAFTGDRSPPRAR